MARSIPLQLVVLLGCIALVFGQQQCTAVNDAIKDLPTDLYESIKDAMDVYTFKGTIFVPTADAWQKKQFDAKFYPPQLLVKMLRYSIVSGVRFAERPALKSGIEQLQSNYTDDKNLFCLTMKRPDGTINVQITVTGTPDAKDTTRFSLAGTDGNTYKAGNGSITVNKVFNDLHLPNDIANMTDAVNEVDQSLDDLTKEVKEVKEKYGIKGDFNLSDFTTWGPSKVVKVVQCEYADVFFVDHFVAPCPLCSKKCQVQLMTVFMVVVLPLLTAFAGALAIAGYLWICFGCTMCSKGGSALANVLKCLCNSMAIIIVLMEVLVMVLFAAVASYFVQHAKKVLAADEKQWKPFYLWAVLGAILVGGNVIAHVALSLSLRRKRKASEAYKPLPYSQHTAPQPIHPPPGGVGPIYGAPTGAPAGYPTYT